VFSDTRSRASMLMRPAPRRTEGTPVQRCAPPPRPAPCDPTRRYRTRWMIASREENAIRREARKRQKGPNTPCRTFPIMPARPAPSFEGHETARHGGPRPTPNVTAMTVLPPPLPGATRKPNGTIGGGFFYTPHALLAATPRSVPISVIRGPNAETPNRDRARMWNAEARDRRSLPHGRPSNVLEGSDAEDHVRFQRFTLARLPQPFEQVGPPDAPSC